MSDADWRQRAREIIDTTTGERDWRNGETLTPRGMDDRITGFIDRYFITNPTPDSMRAIMRLAAFAQGGIAVAGFVLLWHAIGCGLARHHGHAIVCTIGVVVALASFEIAAQTWKRAKISREAIGHR